MKGFEVEGSWKGWGGDAAEVMARSLLLENCEGLPSSSEGSTDTREGTVVGKRPQTILGSPGVGVGKAGGGVFHGWTQTLTSEFLGVRDSAGPKRRI